MAQKSVSYSDVRELRKLVDYDHADLSMSRQCALLGLPRSALYYRLTPLREWALRIMARIEALYLEAPCSGSGRMVHYLADTRAGGAQLQIACNRPLRQGQPSRFIRGESIRNPTPLSWTHWIRCRSIPVIPAAPLDAFVLMPKELFRQRLTANPQQLRRLPQPLHFSGSIL